MQPIDLMFDILEFSGWSIGVTLGLMVSLTIVGEIIGEISEAIKNNKK